MMQKLFFNVYLFQRSAANMAPINTIDVTAAFGQFEDARRLQKILQAEYSGLSFPMYREDAFDMEGNLRPDAVEFV